MSPRFAAPGLLALGVGLALIGCSEPAEEVAQHFEAMALIAEDNREDCTAAAEALGAYLTTHRDDLAENASKVGESTEPVARRISIASQRLDRVVEPCRDVEEMDAFALALSGLVLEATGLE